MSYPGTHNAMVAEQNCRHFAVRFCPRKMIEVAEDLIPYSKRLKRFKGNSIKGGRTPETTASASLISQVQVVV